MYKLIGPLVFLGLIWFTDLSQVGEVWKRGRPLLLIAAAGINILVILVKGWRWRRLLTYQGIDYGFAPAARYYAIGCALGAWTPGRLGDFSRAIAVQKDCKVGLGRAASSVIADRLLDAVVLGGVAAVGAAVLPLRHNLWIGGAGLVAVAITAWVVFRRIQAGGAGAAVRSGAVRIAGVMGTSERMKRLGASADDVGAAIDSLVMLVRPRRVMVLATVAATLLVYLQGYLVAHSLGMEVGFWRLAVALSAVSIASLIPVTVAGIGTREAVLALFLTPAGVTMPEIIGFSLVYFMLISGSLALIGATAWVLTPVSNVRVLP